MNPYRIAVCEDDPHDQEQLKTLLCGIFAASESEDGGAEPEVVCFSTAEALRAAAESGEEFSVFLLDIQMPGESGLDLARWLYGQGVRNRVIFITGSAEYALAGYDAHPLHYLLKPVDREALAAAIALAREAVRPQTVQFQRGGRTVSLPVDRIRFLESRDHGVAVYLEQEERFFSMPLAEAERLLPAGMFARCHKSYLVSLAWVEECGRTEVRLRDGARLPASRTFYRDFQSALVRWLNHSAP